LLVPWWLEVVSKLRGVVALEVDVCDVVVCDDKRRGFFDAEADATAAAEAVAGEEEAEPDAASCWRSRRRAAGTQVLLTWVEQSKPRLLQQVRHRLWPQSFFAWLPQSWHVVAPEPEEPAPVSSIGRGFLR
jgi:hypothetical protein